MDFLNIVELVGLVVMVASAVVNFTPTEVDNKILNGVIKTLDVFALNWSNRTPKQ